MAEFSLWRCAPYVGRYLCPFCDVQLLVEMLVKSLPGSVQVGRCMDDIATIQGSKLVDGFCLGFQGSWLRLLVYGEEEGGRYLLLRL